jgi:hypothetical protein
METRRSHIHSSIRRVFNSTTVTVIAAAWLLLASESLAQSLLKPPFRTYSLDLSPEKVWDIVTRTLSEIDFVIQSEDASGFVVIAIGKPYSVRVGLTTKRERKEINFVMRQKYPGIYDCFADIEVKEFWPVNNRWTTAEQSDTAELQVLLNQRLTQLLKPYFKAVKN